MTEQGNGLSCTYSPDDNKLRIYSNGRLPKKLYERVRNSGFIFAPKQNLFVASMWTPEREDFLLELCDEIGDEDTSLVERAEQRAERFEDYSDKRADEADHAHKAVAAIADHIPFGQPILIGHHSERHARKDAERIQHGMRKATGLWETAKYWKGRAASAIRHMKYKQLPAVRARRIKGLVADKRKQERCKADAETMLALWTNKGAELTKEQAMDIANYDHGSYKFPLAEYPREIPASLYEGDMGLWSALDGGIITGVQAAELAIPSKQRTIVWATRWIAHYENRLTYERAMLEESGGTEADKNKPEKGGACRCWASPRGGYSYIQKVNKVSVSVMDNWGNGGANFSRTIPFDKLTNIISKAAVEEKQVAGLITEINGGIGFLLLEAPVIEEARQQEDPEAALKGLWTSKGISKERQNELIADVTTKAQPGAQVGPFTIPVDDKKSEFLSMKETLRAGIQVVTVPQLFPTPPNIAQTMVELAGIMAGCRILEPNAGQGNLIRAIVNNATGFDCCKIVAVEINPSMAEMLKEMRSKFVYANESKFEIRCADFLSCSNSDLGFFDVIVMNPPYLNAVDVKHIQHARQMLKPNGRLVALCANGDRQRAAFKDIADYWEDLPARSFKAEGTNVNVAMLRLTAHREN